MKPYAKILIVEDDGVLYEGLRRVFVKENYFVEDYTPSYEQAIEIIENNKPDIVLLDINLQGKKTGLDIGKELQEHYKIPFIYVTEYTDNLTFFKGLTTKHEQFIVKTKPNINSEEILRAVQTVLKRYEGKEREESTFTKEGLIGLIDYSYEVRRKSDDKITRIPIKFKDVAFFTRNNFTNKEGKEENVKKNYLRIQTKEKKYYYFYSSMANILKKVPKYFVRVNEYAIINISSDIFDGRINGSRLVINGKEFKISETYKKDFEKKLEKMYEISRK